MIRRANMSEAKHLVPSRETTSNGSTIYREAAEGETEKYEVDRVSYRQTVTCDLEDPLTAAILFREIRRVTGGCDINDVQVKVTFELAMMDERDVNGLDNLIAMSWLCVSSSAPVAEVITYREKRDRGI